MWLIAGWPGVHVQPHRRNGSPDHAQGLCHSRVARQPHPPAVPGIYEVGCGRVFLGDWEVQLGEDSVKTSAVFLCALSLCSLSVGFCSGVACGPDLGGCTS